ncbi:DNA mismatch repair protein Mlh1 [Giardia duodenalis]|uniref:DNA mismatch repair protein Mlh1 n=1 Tax=Giardia intestinalis TaxID=5741 RepID=V6TQ32_GIAIN|nr:DNA mismatch repair protein Mlh1 [Giardia intestinalis]
MGLVAPRRTSGCQGWRLDRTVRFRTYQHIFRKPLLECIVCAEQFRIARPHRQQSSVPGLVRLLVRIERRGYVSVALSPPRITRVAHCPYNKLSRCGVVLFMELPTIIALGQSKKLPRSVAADNCRTQ